METQFKIIRNTLFFNEHFEDMLKESMTINENLKRNNKKSMKILRGTLSNILTINILFEVFY